MKYPCTIWLIRAIWVDIIWKVTWTQTSTDLSEIEVIGAKLNKLLKWCEMVLSHVNQLCPKHFIPYRRQEGNVWFNDAFNTFYLWCQRYGKGPLREETRWSHMGYSFRVAARVILYASSHRQDNTKYSLCYTSHGAPTGTSPSDDPSHHVRTLIPRSYISLPYTLGLRLITGDYLIIY